MVKRASGPAGKNSAQKISDVCAAKGPFLYRLRARRVSLIILLPLSLCLVLIPRACLARWPFTYEKPYLAKVGDVVVTTEEFLEELDRLHTTGRVGKALSEEKSFAVQDYRRFLNEIIDKKLMAAEAERLGLDNDPDFTADLDTLRLNLFLDRLRQDEITDKAKVSDREIEDYYEETKKKEEEAKKEEPAVELEGPPHAVGEKKEETQPMTPARQQKESIRRFLLTKKIKDREKDYFALLRGRAGINVYEGALKGITRAMEKPGQTIVAEVNGEPVYASEILHEMERVKKQDEGFKKEVVEKLILHKLLDREALKRGPRYEREPEIRKKIERLREERLIDLFKKAAVLPAVRVEEKEIIEYYNANIHKYTEPDRFNLKMILVRDKSVADSVVDELRKGADFSRLAKEMSIDPSGEKGGEVGWVPADRSQTGMREVLAGAKPGDILGPFAVEYGYTILEFRGRRKGDNIPLERVKGQIDLTLGREKFKKTLELYLSRLKETVPVETNEAELEKLGVPKKEEKKD